MKFYYYYCFLSLALIGFFSCSNDPIIIPEAEQCPTGSLDDVHLTLGNPSAATTDIQNPNNYLMKLPQYAISYSRDRGIPNWVSWHLDKRWVGESFRQNDFRANSLLPEGWYSPNGGSYQGSGFDRGHNCPSADRTCSDDFNSATFLMTNMFPQAPDVNQQNWVDLEIFCRDLMAQGNELYIIVGNYGQGGVGFFGARNTLDDGNITVPANLYKIVVVLPEGENDASRITADTPVFAIDIPNNNAFGGDGWTDFIVKIDDIEAATGYDFLSNVPENIQDIVESRVYTGPF